MIWIIWAANLIAQTFTSTLASRARNSASLTRHVLASVGSHGVWILQLQLMLGPMMDYLSGKEGWKMQVAAGVYYTTFTVIGGLLAHHWSLRNEHGKAAVGASPKYAQVTVEEWEQLKADLCAAGVHHYFLCGDKYRCDRCMRIISVEHKMLEGFLP